VYPENRTQLDKLLLSYKPKQRKDEKTCSVYPCNFRSAGRLSNENARLLTAVHENFARLLASALDVYMGTLVEVKIEIIEQVPSKDHIAGIPPLSYLAPFDFSAFQSSMIVEWDIEMVFPVIDLLLGGAGSRPGESRELSEIEEEIVHEVMGLIAREMEHSWRLPAGSLTVNRRAKISGMHQYCPPGERITCVRFEMELAGRKGSFMLVFPTAFLNALIKQIKLDQPQKESQFQFFAGMGIRQRILDCDMIVSSELSPVKVAVRDLMELQPGSVLKLRSPVGSAGVLSIGGQEIFECIPVKNGSLKAAQLGKPIQVTKWGKE
jgi:flagellar motor switch protein FliM